MHKLQAISGGLPDAQEPLPVLTHGLVLGDHVVLPIRVVAPALRQAAGDADALGRNDLFKGLAGDPKVRVKDDPAAEGDSPLFAAVKLLSKGDSVSAASVGTVSVSLYGEGG